MSLDYYTIPPATQARGKKAGELASMRLNTIEFFHEEFSSQSSRADMCLNCSLSVKSMKFHFGMMIVFKALKKIGHGAIAKKSVKCEK